MESTIPDPTCEQLLHWQNLAKRIARQAGTLILSMQREGLDSLSISSKSNSTDLVTRADMASQKLIYQALHNDPTTNKHRFIGEEDEQGDNYKALDDQPTWIIDAIDGTTNYVSGLHDFAISIALTIHKKVMIGIVYSPNHNELFSSILGFGSYCNDIPLKIPSKQLKTLKDVLVVSEWGYVRDQQRVQQMLLINQRILSKPCRGIRQLGSGALDICYVAAQRVGAVYCGVLNDSSDAWKIWDYAAASLIAREAGAVMSTVSGDPFDIEADSMVCAHPSVMPELLPLLKL